MSELYDQDEWTFIHVSDIHVGSPRSFRFQPAWNDNWHTARQQIVDLAPDFLLVGGDLTRDGDTHHEELISIKNDLDALPFPAHVIPGNHETGGKIQSGYPASINETSIALFQSVFGPSEWSFVHKGVRFSGLNAFLLGSGLPAEAKLLRWLEAQTLLAPQLAHVWIIHPALFIDTLDEPDYEPVNDLTPWYFGMDFHERQLLMNVFQETGTTHVITGHIHCRRTVIANNITFHLAPSTAFSLWGDRWDDGDDSLGFLSFTVLHGDIRADFVPLAFPSSATGYGPGGNPPHTGRDYSVAWEQPPLTPVTLGT